MCTGLGGVSYWEAVGENVGVCWIGGGMGRLLGEKVGLARTKVSLCVHPLEESACL